MLLYLVYILVYEYDVIFYCTFIYVILFSIHTCIRVIYIREYINGTKDR